MILFKQNGRCEMMTSTCNWAAFTVNVLLVYNGHDWTCWFRNLHLTGTRWPCSNRTVFAKWLPLHAIGPHWLWMCYSSITDTVELVDFAGLYFNGSNGGTSFIPHRLGDDILSTSLHSRCLLNSLRWDFFGLPVRDLIVSAEWCCNSTDHGVLTLSRFILLDAGLLCFICMSVYATVKFHNLRDQ